MCTGRGGNVSVHLLQRLTQGLGGCPPMPTTHLRLRHDVVQQLLAGKLPRLMHHAAVVARVCVQAGPW